MYSILKNIDNAASNYNTNTRATIGGIVGNQQGTITECVNIGNVEAYWVTSNHNGALNEQFVAQGAESAAVPTILPTRLYPVLSNVPIQVSSK